MKKELKVAYLAGPYRSKTKLGIQLNRQLAKIASRKLMEIGYVPIVPHNMFLFDEENETQEDMMEICFAAISKCDVLVLLPGWRESEGTKTELKWTQEQKTIAIIDLDCTEALTEPFLSISKLLKETKDVFDKLAVIP